jgi:DNA-binding MarR family transcriptional regulator
MPNNSKELEVSPAQYAELISDIFSEVMENLLTPESLEKVCGEDITPTQFEVLRFIYRHNKKCPITKLASGLTISRPAATKFVDRLEYHKWVVRVRDLEDGRIWYAQLTPKGMHVVETVKKYRMNLIGDIGSRMELRAQYVPVIESFLKTALEDKALCDKVCQNCGSEATEKCLIFQKWGYCFDKTREDK